MIKIFDHQLIYTFTLFCSKNTITPCFVFPIPEIGCFHELKTQLMDRFEINCDNNRIRGRDIQARKSFQSKSR